jgi:dUTP pyrophosphatase
MKVKVINKSNNELPKYQTVNSAGLDLKANLNKSIFIYPNERSLVPTGLFLELQKGTEAQIRPRSGLALNHGITVLNSPGTIDADYRGEIKVLLINLSNEAFKIVNGDRIAQMVISNYIQIEFQEVESLEETARGVNGLGSTGI